ncbi:hypothetical protein VNO80_34890 [Phaseolus coccineus]|uniref:Uncharacterized protein n=1 Tax=Phaseolus coccineus TaxID=3886 RepID=A0AAN9KQU8_PHACN
MTTSTSFSPINYLIDLDTEYEAMKKAFYQSVAATKAMNAGRINGALNEIEIDNFSKNSVKPVVKQKPSYKDNENLFWSKGKGGTYHATSPTNPKNWRVGITYGVNYRQARSAQQIAEQINDLCENNLFKDGETISCLDLKGNPLVFSSTGMPTGIELGYAIFSADGSFSDCDDIDYAKDVCKDLLARFEAQMNEIVPNDIA